MHKKWAFLFPGQGAQYPGMSKDFYDHFLVARHLFEEADEFLKRSFSKLIFEGPAEELTLTKNSQIAIYIASMALLRVLQEQFPELSPAVCAGLSLGEYTALTAAGKIEFLECLDLVRTRAEAMHQACEECRGGMQVVLGMNEEKIAEVLASLDPPQSVWIANLNCPGQVVIAGSLEGLKVASDALMKSGAKRVLSLEVSGAFHSPLMQSAQIELSKKIKKVLFKSSSTPIVMNVPGDFVFSNEEIQKILIDQVVSPVRWEKGIRKIAETHPVEAYIEIGPGKTLSSMNKRIGITEPTYSIEKIEDLEGFKAKMEAYAIAQG